MEAVPGKKKKMLTETLQPVLCLFIHFRICFTVLKVKLSAIKPPKHLKALSKLFSLPEGY